MVRTEQVTQLTLLWTQAQPSVFAFICSTVTSFADAEDVLQRVAAAVVRKFDDYDDSRPFIPWTLGIARLEVLRFLRDQSTDRHEYVAEAVEHIAAAFDVVQPELDERRQALAACLKHVQGRSREVLEKRYAGGMKSGEIAEAMGLTAGNVSVILNRVYGRLRECIEKQMAVGMETS